MPYSSTANDPHTEIGMLRDEITKEVNGDAEVLADQVFREQRPDLSRVSNEQYDAAIMQKVMQGDRQWLTQEAQRDPQQFIQSRDRLIQAGKVTDPSKPQTFKTPEEAARAGLQPIAPEAPAVPGMPPPVIPASFPPPAGPMPGSPMLGGPIVGPQLNPGPAPAMPMPAAAPAIPPGPVPPY